MGSMDVYYINLDRATERRNRFLKSYHDSHFSDGWRLHRFAAIPGSSEQALSVPGTVPPNQKGAYLSHLGCVRASLGTDTHVLVAEDDTEFCHETEYWVDRVIAQLPEESWDVIMTDFYVPNAVDMPRVLKMRRKCMEKATVALTNAAVWPAAFAGAGAYIVNRRAKEKFLAAMRVDELNTPYDLLLRELLRKQIVNGVLTIPFLTTISQDGDFSQNPIGHDHSQAALMHLFRRLVWIGAKDPASLRQEAERIRLEPGDEDVATLGAIMTPLLSMQMEWF